MENNNLGELKNRLFFLIETLGISKREFERSIGVSNGYISNMVKSMQPDKMERIFQQYPQVEKMWLLTGEGEMLKDNSQNIINSTAGRDIIQTKQEKALDEILKEKDKQLDILHQQIETLKQQIKEKDEQIKTLLNLLQKNS